MNTKDKKKLPSGILENEFTKFIYNYGGDHMINEYVGTYASNEINSYIAFAAEIRRRNHYLPYMIFNTDRRDQSGTHWISLLNFCPNSNILIFDSFGEIGLKHFLITDENITIIKSFFKLKKKSSSTIVFEFNSEKYRNTHNIKSLSKFAIDLCNFLNEFTDYNNLESVDIYYIKNQLQSINLAFCGAYCLYFLYNLFNPYDSSNITEDELCSIETINKLLKELFSNNVNINDTNIKKFIDEFNINGEF